MIKAIIFDCFGVLATEAWLPFKAKYFGNNPKLLEQVNGLSQQANSGAISYEDFMRRIAGLAGITPAEAISAIVRNVPDEQLFTYARELKKDYKIGFLSNVASNRLRQIFTADQLGLFDAVALSFENGFVKPDEKAFKYAAQQLGVDAKNCVLIDDQQRNVDGARAAGMSAILYHDAAQLRQELDLMLKT